MQINYPDIIKEIGRGIKGARPLERGVATALFNDMLLQKIPPLELGAIVMALRIKSESLDEMAGFQDAMNQHCPQITPPPDKPRCIILPTYNGTRRQANLLPLVALLLAQEGIPVLIHGRNDFTERSDTFALCSALGIAQASNATNATQQLTETSISCMPLSALLPGLDQLLALRLRLGVRSSGHTMAKLLDPCPGRSVRVVSVTHREYIERMRETLQQQKAYAMLLRGTEGEAFANPQRGPQIEIFEKGNACIGAEAQQGSISPSSRSPAQQTIDVAHNCALIQKMLRGKIAIPQPIRDQVNLLAKLARHRG